jgi:NADH-quinone oxidoreductase subunit J
MRFAAFHLFSVLACLFALLAITRRNPVHSALMLVLCLLSIAVDYLVLGAAFLAMAQVFVYAGAIVVLFLFVIMLVGTLPESYKRRARDGWIFGAITAVIAFVVLAAKLTPLGDIPIRVLESGPADLAPLLIGTGGVYGEHALAFELGSVLVLAAIIGAVLLSRSHDGGPDA